MKARVLTQTRFEFQPSMTTLSFFSLTPLPVSC
jgi:hypothetical protein